VLRRVFKVNIKYFCGRAAVFLLTIAVVLALLFPPEACSGSLEYWEVYNFSEPVLRMHVKAHNLETEEEKLKNRVWREIHTGILKELEEPSGRADTVSQLKKRIPEIKNTARGVIESRGLDHPVKVEIKRKEFPLRSYQNRVYPPGKYLSLNVFIGEGKGKNWWCMIYPSFCTPPAETKNREDAADTPSSKNEPSSRKENSGQKDTGSWWERWRLIIKESWN